MPRRRPLSPGGSWAHLLMVLAGRQTFLCLLQPQVQCLTYSALCKPTRPLQRWASLLCARCVLTEASSAPPQLISSVASADCPRPWEGHTGAHGLTSGSPLPSRLTPGAGLIERIQAIAQNVSDIAVKVDQILRHSLILHSKGASWPGHHSVSPEASALLDKAEPPGGPIPLVMLAWFLGALLEALIRGIWSSTPWPA